VEIELKFQLPSSQKKAVLQQLKKAKAQRIHLQAKYYDTPDRLLAQHGIAIRLRQEGELWVQTFKAASTSHLQRIEEDIHLGQCTQDPELDLSLYQHNKTVKRLLDKVLGKSPQALVLQFQTDVQRHYYVVNIEDSQIEVCFDDGEVRTPDASSRICEVEFELKQGSILHLIELAKSWGTQYELWLDVRSKAERGSLLAIGKAVSPAVRAKNVVLSPDMSAEQILQCITANCLNQLLPNSSAIAGEVAEADHIHQARIAMRRLRSALKHFGQWSTQVDPHWQERIAQLFRQLGTTRDSDVVNAEIIPALKLIGAPDLSLPKVDQDSAQLSTVFTKTDSVNLLLDLLSFVHADSQPIAKQQKLNQKIAEPLQHLYQRITKKAKDFSKFDIEARHRIRKQVKQLRYLIEFTASVYPEKQVKRFLKQLQPVQDSLGLYNDMIVAETLFAQQVERDPHFWFAVGWAKAQQQHLLHDAEKALIAFAQIKTFW
jgi:inorganic triphosphatase YgiF